MKLLPTFETWLDYCFDHPVSDPSWYFDIDAPTCELPANVIAEYLTRLFNAPLESVGRFTDDQLSQGFWYLGSPSSSDTMFCLVDESVSEAKRIACVNAMKRLYTELFATRCSETTSNGSTHLGDASALNSVCYMWWDIVPVHGKPEMPERARLDEAILNLLEECLSMASVACQESALHGLGHWAPYYPTQVRSAVQSYLDSSGASPLLRNYALAAQVGNVQ